MAPFLRDEGPPVSARTIQRARDTLPPEYGHELVNESGRETLLVRVPKAKPDYLNDLAEVAFYVSEDTIRNTKDILLVGDEKTSRLEPQRLRDHIRAQRREDEDVVTGVRGQLDRTYGQTIHRSPSNYEHHALVLRIPKRSVNDFSPDDVVALRHVLHTNGNRFDDCQYGYIIADTDHERLGKRTLVELAGTAPEPAAEPEPASTTTVDVDVEDTFTEETLDVSDYAPAAAAAESAPEPAPWPDHGTPLPPTAKPTNAPETMPLPSAETEEYEIISRPAKAPVAPSEPVHAAPVAPANVGDEDVEAEETYEILSRPAAKPVETPTPAPVAPAPAHVESAAVPARPAAAAPVVPARKSGAPQPALSTGDPHLVTDEYEVVSRKPTPPPVPTPAPVAAAAAPAAVQPTSRPDSGYEIMSSPRRAEPERAPATPAPVAAEPAAGRTRGYEIMSSRALAAETRIPQLQRAAQQSPNASMHPAIGAAPLTTIRDEGRPTYPRMGAVPSSLPTSTALPSTAAPVPTRTLVPEPPHAPAPVVVEAAPVAHAPVVAIETPVIDAEAAPVVAPIEDVPAVEAPVVEDVVDAPVPELAVAAPPVDPVAILASTFKSLGYELVEGVKAQGHAFAFAAHATSGGRRVLVTKADAFAASDVQPLADLIAALGADIGLVVADRVESGARLASWGTTVQVLAPDEVARLTF